MVKIERTPVAPKSLEEERAKKNGTYDTWEVRALLKSDSRNKCYLCERKPPHSPEIEHLRPHQNGKYPDLKFAWNNLFYSCRHCNLMKKANRYATDVLDCCEEDPEAVIHHSIRDRHVRITPIANTNAAKNTAQLVEDCFEKDNTPARLDECQEMFNALMQVMTLLNKKLRVYRKEPSEEILGELAGMLSRDYEFSGFTRTYVRDHLGKFPDLEPYVKLDP